MATGCGRPIYELALIVSTGGLFSTRQADIKVGRNRNPATRPFILGTVATSRLQGGSQMQMSDIPFGTTDWPQIERVKHKVNVGSRTCARNISETSVSAWSSTRPATLPIIGALRVTYFFAPKVSFTPTLAMGASSRSSPE